MNIEEFEITMEFLIADGNYQNYGWDTSSYATILTNEDCDHYTSIEVFIETASEDVPSYTIGVYLWDDIIASSVCCYFVTFLVPSLIN